MKWANVGAGKLYRPFKLQVTLREASGQSVCGAVGQADPCGWLPGERAISEVIQLPASVKPGAYTLTVALVDTVGQRPPLRLAMDAPDHAGHYTVSKVNVQPE
jgi:hypothetical protein